MNKIFLSTLLTLTICFSASLIILAKESEIEGSAKTTTKISRKSLSEKTEEKSEIALKREIGKTHSVDREAKKSTRCLNFVTKRNERLASQGAKVDARVAEYLQMNRKVDALMTKFAEQGIDTASADASLAKFRAAITAITTANKNYIAVATDSNPCAKDVNPELVLAASKTSWLNVVAAITDAKQVYQLQLKPALLNLKATLP